jgi:hypothetical protein
MTHGTAWFKLIIKIKWENCRISNKNRTSAKCILEEKWLSTALVPQKQEQPQLAIIEYPLDLAIRSLIMSVLSCPSETIWVHLHKQR